MARTLTESSTFFEDELRSGVLAEAKANLGHLYRDSAVPYNWPPDQFDCSVFVHYIWSRFGIDPDAGARFVGEWPVPKPSKAKWKKFPGYTMTQLNACRRLGAEIDFKDVQVGDALYYADVTGKPYFHVTIYAGDGEVVHAAGTAYGVIRSSVVGPGQVGHGNKKLVGVISLGKVAEALGVLAKPTVTKVTLTKRARIWNTPYIDKAGVRKKGDAALVVEARKFKNRLGHAVTWLRLKNDNWVKASKTTWKAA